MDNIPRFPGHLPGSFWGITAYFNPAGYKSRNVNYLKFQASCRRQGLRLLTVELAFGDQLYELKEGDADILIQLRGNEKNILWQKEALLNIALERLPDHCDKVAWLDGDILFKNGNWVAETSGLLESYKIVQPFSSAVFLGAGQEDIDPLTVPFGFSDGKQVYGMAYRVAECGHGVIGGFLQNGHMGFAWAARRDVLQAIKFYDRTPGHHGDSLMAWAFYGASPAIKQLSPRLAEDYAGWWRSASETVAGSVYYTPGVLMHLWHGSINDRGYTPGKPQFMDVLKEFAYDPEQHILKDGSGLLEWVSDNDPLARKIREHFSMRNEDRKEDIKEGVLL